MVFNKENPFLQVNDPRIQVAHQVRCSTLWMELQEQEETFHVVHRLIFSIPCRFSLSSRSLGVIDFSICGAVNLQIAVAIWLNPQGNLSLSRQNQFGYLRVACASNPSKVAYVAVCVIPWHRPFHPSDQRIANPQVIGKKYWHRQANI